MRIGTDGHADCCSFNSFMSKGLGSDDSWDAATDTNGQNFAFNLLRDGNGAWKIQVHSSTFYNAQVTFNAYACA